MATEAAPSAPINGVAPKADSPLLPGPGNVARAQARIRTARAGTLAALEAGNLDEKPAEPAKPVETEKSDPVEDPKTDETPEEPGTDGEITKPDLQASDPETSKRVAAIQKAEQRSREKLAAREAEIDAKAKNYESEWAPKIRAAEEFEQLKTQARKGSVHLIDAIRKLGFGDDDLEPMAQVLYAASKAGQADPARRAQADRLLRDREQVTELSATQKRLDDLEKKLADKDRQQQTESVWSQYLDHAVKAVTDETPATKALATKNPTRLRAVLKSLTERMMHENDGEAPDVDDVVATYERIRRAELEELGIDPATAFAPKKNNQTADKKPPAKTLGNDLSTPRVPRATKSDREHRAETLEMLESGRLE